MMMITSVPLRSHRSNIRHFPDGLVCRPEPWSAGGVQSIKTDTVTKVVGIERRLHHLRLLCLEWE